VHALLKRVPGSVGRVRWMGSRVTSNGVWVKRTLLRERIRQAVEGISLHRRGVDWSYKRRRRGCRGYTKLFAGP
jgi:hypothetical protein